ncbi:MAG: calcium/sodium antiporter [Clostridiales bacterium]|nr:calcium/sodium antiporter [Clostridiales bacterium]
MLIPVLLFLLGLLFLIKGGDWFVDGATGIARRFRIPEIIVGATVVSIGTTLPEVMVSATSAVMGHGEIAYGNAIGSVICNTALISALTLTILPGKVDRKSFRTPVIFFFIAAAFYILNAYLFGGFARWSGIVLLSIFAVYMILTVRQGLAGAGNDLPAADEEEEREKPIEPVRARALWLDLVLLVVGAALIAVGADLLVDNGTKIAAALGVPESVIALTFVALGTSLPELVTAITSLAKGHGALSLGNVVGANLFNLVLVSGMSITLNPFELPAGKTVAGMNASLVVDVPVMLIVMWIMTIPALITGRMRRWQGISLLMIYAAFCVFQFIG